jgi:hypothetical protein
MGRAGLVPRGEPYVATMMPIGKAWGGVFCQNLTIRGIDLIT